jgi:excinuclease ABC subunit C
VQYLARIRDEAHRFAITHNRKRRSKATLRTTLTGIPGVGPTRARALLKHFGSVTKVREATLDELQEAPGISPTLAEVIFAQRCRARRGRANKWGQQAVSDCSMGGVVA